MARLRLLFLLTGLLAVGRMAAAEYFVAVSGRDTNDGRTVATAFASLPRAAAVLAPGDVVTVAAGVYEQGVSFFRSGTAAAPIVVRAAARGAVRIVGAVGIRCAYFEFSGFEVSSSPLHGITVVGHHVRVLANDVHDSSGHGISAYRSDYLTVEGNRVYRNGGGNATQSAGIHIFQPVAVDEAPGFHLVIRGNQSFLNESVVNTRAADYTRSAGLVLEDFRHATEGSTAGPYGAATLLENNLLHDNVGRALVLSGVDRVTVRHNTIWNNLRLGLPESAIATLGHLSCEDVGDVVVLNNIIVGRDPSTLAIFEARSARATWDYNIIWNGGVTLAGGLGALGPNNLLADPRLAAPAEAGVAPAGLAPAAGSPAIDAGSAASAAATDFAGQSRPRGSGVDIGAFETSPAAPSPVVQPPTFAAAPADTTALVGGLATLSVWMTGSAPLSFQWFREGVPIPDATRAAYTRAGVTAGDAGRYTVAVTNAAGTTTSGAITLSLVAEPEFSWRSPLPRGGSLLAVAYAAGRFVAVGVGGRILTSTDGQSWTLAATVRNAALRGVASDGSQWVAVGDGGVAYTSRDTVTWVAHPTGAGATLWSVTFANGRYFACGDAGAVFASGDGVNWVPRPTGAAEILFGLAGNGNRLVAVGQGGALLTSTEGEAWTRVPLASGTADLTAAAYLNGQFVVVGRGGAVHTSPDGLAWTSRSVASLIQSFRGIAYHNGRYILVTEGERVVLSDDLAGFQGLDLPFNRGTPHWGVAAGGGRVVAVGAGGEVAVSSDGQSWQSAGATGARWEHRGVAFLGTEWFVTGSAGGLFVSPDGATWEQRPTPTDTWLSNAAFGGGRYVVIGDEGYVMSSTDGVTWQGARATAGVTQSLRSVAYQAGANRFVAVGYGGAMLVSPDGRAWQRVSAGVTANLHAVGSFADGFVAVGEGGLILVSANGSEWSAAASGTTAPLYGLGTDGRTLLVVGAGRTLLASTDGRSWAARLTPIPDVSFQGVAPVNGGWLAVGTRGLAYFSADGFSWKELPELASQEGLLGLASNGLSTVVVGAGGTILQAGNPALTPSRLGNVATRGLVQPGTALTPGFVLKGTGAKSVIVRAVGPTLTQFDLAGISDVRLELVNQQTGAMVAANDDWGGEASLASAFARAGAFPLPLNSKDAAVAASLPVNRGGYTVRIAAGAGVGPGVALAEVYDLDADGASARLANVSTLGFVGTGNNVLTPGFVIRGSAPKLVLIRAVGPGLTPLGVGGVLADPQIAVFPAGSNTALASNNNWGGSAALKAAFAAAGAFSLPDGSRDAALVATLPPGGYTVVASGVGATTGTAIVEVYDLDP